MSEIQRYPTNICLNSNDHLFSVSKLIIEWWVLRKMIFGFNLLLFKREIRRYLPHCCSDKGLKGTEVNRTCHSINRDPR